MSEMFNFNAGLRKDSGSTSGLKSQRKVLSQEAIDKLIYDVMASDQGLASLASGENLSGVFNSSSKTLLAQDLTAKLIGELANVTAETLTSENTTSKSSSKSLGGGLKTVICTELALQGYLDPKLYEAGGPPSKQVSKTTWCGYHVWATKVVPRMKVSPVLCKFLAPIVISRYRYLTGVPGFHLLGRASVYLGHPVCYLIGTALKMGGGYGRASEFA